MIREALAEYARATARVLEDRTNTVGASEIGQCARKTFFAKKQDDWQYGAPADADHVESWGAALRGSVFEDVVWVPALRRRFGDRLLYAGAGQKTLVSEFLSATPDGLLTNLPPDILAPLGVADIGGDRSLVVECKTADPRTKLDEAKPEHVYQAQVQLGLIRELTKHRPGHALVSYTNASFWNEVAEFPVAFNPSIFANAKQRATQIMTACAPEEIKPEGWISGGRECEYCRFTNACGRLRHAVPTQAPIESLDPQFIAELADLARAAKHQRHQAEVATAALRETEHELRERMRTKGARHIVGDGVAITWSPVKGRPAYDMQGIREAAEKAGVNISQFETVGDSTDRLTITIQAAASVAA
jgi:hypothetical protein